MKQKRALSVLFLLLFTVLFAASASSGSADDTTLDLRAIHASQTICSCDVSVFLLELTNSWKAVDAYSLWIEGIDSQSYVLSDSFVVLQPGKRALVYAYLRPPCGTTGSFSLTAKAHSGVQGNSVTVPLSFDILDCGERVLTTEQQSGASWVYMLYLTSLLYVILGILAVAVLVIVILVVKRTAPSFRRWLRRYQFLLPLCLSLGILFLIIGAFAYPLVQQHYEYRESLPASEDIEEPESSESATKDTFFTPKVTGRILIGVLILLGVLAWYWRRRLGSTAMMQQKKGKMYKKTAKDMRTGKHAAFYDLAAVKEWGADLRSTDIATRVKPVFKWCWMALLLLVLLAGIGAGLYFLYPTIVVSTIGFSDGVSEESEPLDEASEETTMESDTLTESLSDLETKYATLEEQLKNIQEDIQTVDEKLDALTALLDELKQESSASDTLIADVQKEIDALQKEKESLEETVGEVEEIAPLLETIEEEKEPLSSALSETEFKTVLIFDISLSGQIEEEGTTRFVHGLTLAKRYIEPEGSYTIMIAGKNALVVKQDVSADIAVHALRTLRPLDTQSNLGKALYAAAEYMGSALGRIVLVSDLVTTDGTNINKIRKELMKEGFDVVFLPFSSSEENSEESPVREKAEETVVEEGEETEISEEGSDVEETVEEAQEEMTEEETTSDAEADDTTAVFDVENETQGTFFIEIPKNTAYRIDLNTYFVDEDADLLVYTATAGEHLSAIIEENFVTLTPELDWTGETSVQFIADDTNGGVVESPVIRVVVSENTASPQSTYIPWIILGSIIVLIIVSLISGAFAKKFHRDPEMPPENEEE